MFTLNLNVKKEKCSEENVKEKRKNSSKVSKQYF